MKAIGRAFAVGAGDMDHRRQAPLRMIERGEHTLDAVKREIDPLGMQRQQPRQHGVDGAGAGCALTSSPARAPASARRCGAGGRLGQQPAEIGDGRAQLMAMHHHVDHAVIAQIFGASGIRPAASRGWSAR